MKWHSTAPQRKSGPENLISQERRGLDGSWPFLRTCARQTPDMLRFRTNAVKKPSLCCTGLPFSRSVTVGLDLYDFNGMPSRDVTESQCSRKSTEGPVGSCARASILTGAVARCGEFVVSLGLQAVGPALAAVEYFFSIVEENSGHRIHIPRRCCGAFTLKSLWRFMGAIWQGISARSQNIL